MLGEKNSEVIATITDNEGIEEFVQALQINKWKLEKAPSNSSIEKRFILFNSETKKLGRSNDKEKELKEVAKIMVFQDVPYIDFQIKKQTFSFKVPKEVSDYMNNLQ